MRIMLKTYKKNIIHLLNTDLLKDNVQIPEEIELEEINAKELLLKNKRFDLIIKYLYVKAKEENIA